MQPKDLLNRSRTVARIGCSSKKRILEHVAHLIASDVTLSEEALFSSLFEREKLGSTGVGDGVAIPHCRSAEVNEITGAFMTLESPVDYDAPDGKPVDIVFALIVPHHCTEGHLEALQAIASMLNQSELRQLIRRQTNNEQLFDTVNTGHKG
jgi:PTS system nitrogen regulatory IIA component